MKDTTIFNIEEALVYARAKYPKSTDYAYDATMRGNGIVQEFGEALQALGKWGLSPNSTRTQQHLRAELYQAIAMAVRFLEEVPGLQ
jgi:hypothetical protein